MHQSIHAESKGEESRVQNDFMLDRERMMRESLESTAT